jgi:signal transduction histidine kinase
MNPTQSSRRPLVLGLALALSVLGATLCWSMCRLREHICAQIANRDGETIEAVAAMQHLDDKTSDETIAPLADPGEQMQLVLKISHLHNVLGVRLFSPDGKFVNAVPAYITEAELPADTLAGLRELKPVSRFLPRARLEEQVLGAESDAPPVALLEVNIPLHEEGENQLAGIAQFLLNGTSIARQYAALDRNLALETGLAFLIGGAILAGGLGLAFGRVRRANRLLAERTATLLQANRELALAAKTSAVGAVASHLIHGLKNPLSGLQSFVRDHAEEPTNSRDDAWQLAVSSTERMRQLIDRVVRVLQEDQGGTSYQISLEELLFQMLTNKLQPSVHAAGVRFETSAATTAVFTNHEADLILLILENLLQNAVDVTPPGQAVRLTVFAEKDQLVLEVQDEGPGLPAEVQARLFSPCHSSKKGGSGIGLSISRQLANHLGGELQLRQSTPQGCTFRLTLPRPANPEILPAPATLSEDLPGRFELTSLHRPVQ